MAEQLNTKVSEKNNRLKLSNEDREILSELYRRLGEEYYNGAFEDPLPQLLPIFDKITALLKKYTEHSKKCGNCGAELDDDARFCQVCGTPVEEKAVAEEKRPERVCGNCGSYLSPEAKFCGNCGAPVK